MMTLLGALVALVMLPTGITVWARRAALAAHDADPAQVWFVFARWQRAALLTTWVGWMAATWLGRLWLPVASGLDGVIRPGLVLGAIVVLVPPALVHLLCQAISFPVVREVRAMDLSCREMLAEAGWHLASLIPPVILLVAAVEATQHQAWRPAVLYVGAALVAHVIARQRRMRSWQLDSHAVTSGELRDRVFALARRAGVRVQQLYVVPASRARLANALAAMGNVVALTDYLLLHLSRREVDAVVAHELAHLRRRHPLLLLVAAMALVWLFWGWGSIVPGWDVPLRAVVAIGLILLLSRHFERSADRQAAALVGDPEALIAALAKLGRLNLLPVSWGKVDEAFLSHPSIERRARLLAGRHGIAWERVATLLAAPPEDDDRYPLPPALGEDPPAFSSLFRRRLSNTITWSMLAAMAVPPVLVVWVLGRIEVSLLAYGAIAVAGAVLTIAGSQLLALVAPVWMQRGLEAKVRARLVRRGHLDEQSTATGVGIAPGPYPRLFENNFSFDVGFLMLGAERMEYVGETVRFALTRDEITSVGLGARLPSWWRPAAVVLGWRSRDGREGWIQIRASRVGSLRVLDRRSRELARTIESWRHRPQVGPATGESAFPEIGEVTCQTPREGVRPFGCIVLAGIATLLAAALAVLTRAEASALWYVVSVALAALVFHFLPLLAYRDRLPAPLLENREPPTSPPTALL